MKIVIVSPHREDAAFSVGLAAGLWLEAGHAVCVVDCFTRSKHAPFAETGLIHEHDQLSHITALRQREDESWRRLYGKRLTALDLNLKDAPVRLRCSPEETYTLKPVPGEKAMLKIAKAVAQQNADALVLPLAVGQHIDHLAARDAALTGYSLAQPCAFYEDLPYSAQVENTASLASIAAALDLELKPAFAAADRNQEGAVQRKRQIALCYDSLIDEETTQLIAGFCNRYEGRERLWANDAWRRSVLAWPSYLAS